MNAKLAARIADDNKAAAALPTGTTYKDGLFGTVVLGEKSFTGEEGWDIYEVLHSGFNHMWASGLVWRAFATEAK